MNVVQNDLGVSNVAAAIAEPARTRMLCALMDGHARTSTELAAIAEVSTSTASAHLAKLRDAGLLRVQVQGRHRYYGLGDPLVAQALEALMVIGQGSTFTPRTPDRLQFARTCYDHLAGTLGVQLHDRMLEAGWLLMGEEGEDYRVSDSGVEFFRGLGIDVAELSRLRRNLACPCLDWSMRSPHLAGALGAALLRVLLQRKWLRQDVDSRALTLTGTGGRYISKYFGIALIQPSKPLSASASLELQSLGA
ncbi:MULTISPECIES: ArsR/SmtB family transcription factor [Pseudomonas]|uniref:ArsR/SmtB family transcription factor n=1 Tax=Pseudomonas TaxID=286 RepID=UPI000C9D2533|nr:MULTISPECIES: metalloregulator ArsR/SmtB family transcription factor [Pseudomonas]AXK57136.1 ArsR family transcriptional regulator [Pseudomonas protegens]MCL9657827.1 metalloregulator ArsR/SmtB family transcription factor [Pseudomonas protegens]MDP4568321.1 metalloregulator ArsR/SmtB family transcription factor [Pseudomonas sp. LPH60]PNG30139.1 ArsR family transcriptional regulator [Pseudomonas protegens]BCT32962.1 transcriptional regulator [Pseudomonas protegens]